MLVAILAGALPFFLGLVFLSAGASKLYAPHTTASAFGALGVTDRIDHSALARSLGVGELTVGVALASGVATTLMLVLAIAALVGFMRVLARLRSVGFDSFCGCFGQDEASAQISRIRNGVLLLVGGFALTLTWIPSGVDSISFPIHQIVGFALFLLSAMSYRTAIAMDQGGLKW